MDCFLKAIAIDPSNADAYTHCGIMTKEMDKLNEAATYLRKALEIDPQHSQAKEYLSQVLTDIATHCKALGNVQQGTKEKKKRTEN